MYHRTMISSTLYFQMMCAVGSVAFTSLMRDTKLKEIDLVPWEFS